MNPLPRFLGLALFVVLAILAALLAAPLWQRNAPDAPPASASASVSAAVADAPSTDAPATAAPALPVSPRSTPRVVHFSQRLPLVFALIGLVLALALVVSLSLRAGSAADTRAPFAATRQEIGTLTRLAQDSAARGEELSRERDVRRRAEEDAQLKQALLAQSVEEKIRLGRDLHDGIIQALYAAGLTLESMRPLLRADPAQAERRLDEVRASLNAAIRDVRAYITGLAPENLRRASFSRGVTALFEQLRAGRPTGIEIKADDEAAAELSLEQNLEALQIAREAISNALRHGAATQITVRLHRGDGEVCLLVQDNGRGFDVAQERAGGFGLANMRARAERLGATLRLTSRPGEGTRVVANFPIPQPPVV
ncbi:sensor histidine kinase [Opitutus sp. ER46]|uniref:sensor histidine kinase n=1 Tax=Opitutus sp. ER46 TaxID=2161864 RepID=UPI001304C65A|nr:sensor histidine kinase [Opitutus sp. ER46]